jgi:hypothetical protein
MTSCSERVDVELARLGPRPALVSPAGLPGRFPAALGVALQPFVQSQSGA